MRFLVVVLVFLLLVLALVVVASYNRFVRQRTLVAESWGQTDVELTRRHDLVPNLVRTVQAYAAHERAVRETLVRAEAYPELRASEGFLRLQRDLTDTEDRIAAARRFYNGNVRAYNTRVATFPSNVVAGLFGFAAAAFFELRDLTARLPPSVDPSSQHPG